jgi:hypothetical protein
MNKSSSYDEIIEQIIKLRAQAVAAYDRCEKLHARIEFYRKYVAFRQRFKVRLAGPFILIQGARSTEDAPWEAEKERMRHSTSK